MRASRIAVPLLVLGLALTGCTGPDRGDVDRPQPSDLFPTGDPSDESKDVAFTACDDSGYPCEGFVDGTPYAIVLPETWNGTLLIYSHGLRPEVPLTADGPDFTAVAEPAPGVGSGVDAVADELLSQGYALAGAGSRTGGWDLQEAVEAISTVRGIFVQNVGVPNRIYTWGQSLGGLAALQAGQANDWVSGSASLCGLLGGLNPNMDLALDAAFGVKALLRPNLQLTDFDSAEQAQEEYARAMGAVEKAAADPTGAGLVDLRVIAAAAEVPTQTRTSAGSTPDELGAALVENFGRVLARSMVQRYSVEQQLGGNPSTNVGVNYGARVTADEAAAIDGSAGALATLSRVREIAAQPAVEADPAARAAADAQFPQPGPLVKPTVTLHTEVDPEAILANETLYGTWAAQASGDDIRWLNINVSTPPAPTAGVSPTASGVGHCAFTGQSIVGGVQILDDWARRGRFPTWAGNAIAFGPGSGFVGPTRLPAWPQSPTTLAMAAPDPAASGSADAAPSPTP